MLYVYEFEMVEDDGFFLVFPFDWEGGTQGHSHREAYEMTADWLKLACEDCLIRGISLPEPTFANKPKHGGSVFVMAVDASLDAIEKLSASEAARLLGVSPGRVSQLIADGTLYGWRDGHRSWVTKDSVEARLAANPTPGRPKRAKSLVV